MSFCKNSTHRRVAHIGSKVRTNPPSFAKFRFFFLFALRARLILSSHDVSAAQTKLKKFGRTGLSTCLVHESRAVGVATTSTEVGVQKSALSTVSAFFIFLDRSARSVSLLQGPAKHDETNQGIRHGRTSQALFFGFSRGRSGNQPEPNGLTLFLVHLSRFESLRPRKSRQAAR